MSGFNKYKQFMDKYVSLNQIEWTLFKSKLKVIHHKKGEIIHYAGDVCTKLMFINYGIIRAYVIDINGKDYTWNICFNDTNSKMTNVYIVDYDSFVNQNQSKISFEDLINEAPYLLEKVPQYHIATYLGITPQSLSRLKNLNAK